MCFLTYICYYLFLFHTLFYYKNGDCVFHLMEVLLYQACENGLTLCQALPVTKLSDKLLSELRYQDMISVHCNVNNLLPIVAFSKAILSHENSMSHSMSILSGKYTYPFFDTFVKNEFCNRIVNSYGLALFQKRDFLH